MLFSIKFIQLTLILTTTLLFNIQQCDSNNYYNEDQNNPATSSMYLEKDSEPESPPQEIYSQDNSANDGDVIDDGDSGGGGRNKLNPLTTYIANGRYHRSTTTTTWSPNNQPFRAQSTIVGTSNYVPTAYKSNNNNNNRAPSETAIRFPDLGNPDYNTSLYARVHGGVHGGNTFQQSQGHAGGGGGVTGRRGKHIPVDFFRKLSRESDVSQIFAKYVSNVKVEDVDGQKRLFSLQGEALNVTVGGGQAAGNQPLSNTTGPKIMTSFSDRTVTPAAFQTGKVTTTYAGCEPELQTVELPPSNDPSVVQYPRCVRLERCGGCCASDLLSCEPVMVKTAEVQVQKFSYNDLSEKLEYKETETVLMDVHTSCRCNCRVKSRDCTSRHEYNSDDCACVCKNKREHEICLRQSHKLWDPNLCQCLCREIQACSSGYSFNLDTCQCARLPDLRSNTDMNRKRRRSH